MDDSVDAGNSAQMEAPSEAMLAVSASRAAQVPMEQVVAEGSAEQTDALMEGLHSASESFHGIAHNQHFLLPVTGVEIHGTSGHSLSTTNMEGTYGSDIFSTTYQAVHAIPGTNESNSLDVEVARQGRKMQPQTHGNEDDEWELEDEEKWDQIDQSSAAGDTRSGGLTMDIQGSGRTDDMVKEEGLVPEGVGWQENGLGGAATGVGSRGVDAVDGQSSVAGAAQKPKTTNKVSRKLAWEIALGQKIRDEFDRHFRSRGIKEQTLRDYRGQLCGMLVTAGLSVASDGTGSLQTPEQLRNFLVQKHAAFEAAATNAYKRTLANHVRTLVGLRVVDGTPEEVTDPSEIQLRAHRNWEAVLGPQVQVHILTSLRHNGVDDATAISCVELLPALLRSAGPGKGVIDSNDQLRDFLYRHRRRLTTVATDKGPEATAALEYACASVGVTTVTEKEGESSQGSKRDTLKDLLGPGLVSDLEDYFRNLDAEAGSTDVNGHMQLAATLLRRAGANTWALSSIEDLMAFMTREEQTLQKACDASPELAPALTHLKAAVSASNGTASLLGLPELLMSPAHSLLEPLSGPSGINGSTQGKKRRRPSVDGEDGGEGHEQNGAEESPDDDELSDDDEFTRPAKKAGQSPKITAQEYLERWMAMFGGGMRDQFEAYLRTGDGKRNAGARSMDDYYGIVVNLIKKSVPAPSEMEPSVTHVFETKEQLSGFLKSNWERFVAISKRNKKYRTIASCMVEFALPELADTLPWATRTRQRWAARFSSGLRLQLEHAFKTKGFGEATVGQYRFAILRVMDLLDGTSGTTPDSDVMVNALDTATTPSSASDATNNNATSSGPDAAGLSMPLSLNGELSPSLLHQSASQSGEGAPSTEDGVRGEGSIQVGETGGGEEEEEKVDEGDNPGAIHSYEALAEYLNEHAHRLAEAAEACARNKTVINHLLSLVKLELSPTGELVQSSGVPKGWRGEVESLLGTYMRTELDAYFSRHGLSGKSIEEYSRGIVRLLKRAGATNGTLTTKEALGEFVMSHQGRLQHVQAKDTKRALKHLMQFAKEGLGASTGIGDLKGRAKWEAITTPELRASFEATLRIRGLSDGSLDQYAKALGRVIGPMFDTDRIEIETQGREAIERLSVPSQVLGILRRRKPDLEVYQNNRTCRVALQHLEDYAETTNDNFESATGTWAAEGGGGENGAEAATGGWRGKWEAMVAPELREELESHYRNLAASEGRAMDLAKDSLYVLQKAGLTKVESKGQLHATLVATLGTLAQQAQKKREQAAIKALKSFLGFKARRCPGIGQRTSMEVALEPKNNGRRKGKRSGSGEDDDDEDGLDGEEGLEPPKVEEEGVTISRRSGRKRKRRVLLDELEDFDSGVDEELLDLQPLPQHTVPLSLVPPPPQHFFPLPQQHHMGAFAQYHSPFMPMQPHPQQYQPFLPLGQQQQHYQPPPSVPQQAMELSGPPHDHSFVPMQSEQQQQQQPLLSLPVQQQQPHAALGQQPPVLSTVEQPQPQQQQQHVVDTLQQTQTPDTMQQQQQQQSLPEQPQEPVHDQQQQELQQHQQPRSEEGVLLGGQPAVMDEMGDGGVTSESTMLPSIDTPEGLPPFTNQLLPAVEPLVVTSGAWV